MIIGVKKQSTEKDGKNMICGDHSLDLMKIPKNTSSNYVDENQYKSEQCKQLVANIT